MKKSILMLLPLVLLCLSIAPSSSAISLPNISEGNYTSWSQVYTISSGQPAWGTGVGMTFFLSTDGSLLISASGNTYSISESGTITTLGLIVSIGFTTSPVQSAFGAYLDTIASNSASLKVFKNTALQATITNPSGFSNIAETTISSDGKFIALVDGSNPAKVALFQGAGQDATLPLTSNVCVVGGGVCNSVNNGQSNYVFGGGVTTTNVNTNILGGNYTGAQQQIQANPLPYGLIALIIILTIGAAIYLRFTDKSKGGFRQPRTTGRGYRGP